MIWKTELCWAGSLELLLDDKLSVFVGYFVLLVFRFLVDLLCLLWLLDGSRLVCCC